MHKKCTLALLLASSLVTVSALAQDNKQPPPRRDPEEIFKKLDTNSDDKISKEEADKAAFKMIKDHFTDIDSNKDGYISKDEFKAFRPKRPEGAPNKD
ncbi:MAG: EF-hand domain-containing protein [Bacteroidetes bacterium]|nr:EF-hand domain-containing protein [Bacteroidota bacterium]